MDCKVENVSFNFWSDSPVEDASRALREAGHSSSDLDMLPALAVGRRSQMV